MRACDFLLKGFLGFSPVVAREVAFCALGDCETEINSENAPLLLAEFKRLVESLNNGDFTPNAVYDKENNGIEYSFIPLSQYGEAFEMREYESFSALLTDYFGRK